MTANPNEGAFYDCYRLNPSGKHTLFFIGPYGGKKYYFYRFFVGMARRDYEIVFLQPCKEVLSTIHMDWLEKSIMQATHYIARHKAKGKKPASIVGASLGSYLSLNVLLNEPFERLVVIGGGAPLGGVFRTNLLFRKARRALHRSGGLEALDTHWKRFDEAFRLHELDHLRVLMINSNNDRVIRPPALQEFVAALRQAGAQVINRQKGRLPHTAVVMSLNLRVAETDAFVKGELSHKQ